MLRQVPIVIVVALRQCPGQKNRPLLASTKLQTKLTK